MNEQKETILNLFSRFVEAFNQLSESDFLKLSDKSYSIEIRLIKKKFKGEVLPVDSNNLKLIVEKITALHSREEADSFLLENYPTRKLIEPIAIYLDIPSSKQDKIEVLRNKIIETTVGARIRSQAIQGNNSH